MKNLNKLVLVLAACLVAPLASVFAGSHYNSVYSGSYYYQYGGYGNDGYRSSQGEITAPEGAEVNWEATAYGSGFGYAYASVNSTGVIGISASATAGQSVTGYAFFPSGGGTLYYSITADSSAYYGGWDGSYQAYAMIVAGW